MEKPTGMQSPYLSYEGASSYCNVHRTTLWRAVKAGRLKTSGPGTAVRFHVRDLDEFMAVAGDQDR